MEPTSIEIACKLVWSINQSINRLKVPADTAAATNHIFVKCR